MKNISISFSVSYLLITLVLLGSLFICSSCENVLLEEPKQVVEENFYTNAGDVKSAVNAAYLPFRSGGFTASYTAIVDVENDYGYGRGSRSQYNSWTAFNSTNINRAQGIWNSFYQGIRDANLVIRNAPTQHPEEQTEINQLVAEAKFMRAYFYLQLVRCWGGVPLRTEANMEEKDLARSPVDDVYGLIVSDLLDAEVGLPTQQADIGRPTTYAAKTMLADVSMDIDNYSEARAKAKEVIDANVYALVPVTTRDDFWNIFGPDILTSSEEIWFV